MTLSVVVLAWGAEPYLAECIGAIRASVGVDAEGMDVELVVVDNGGRGDDAPMDLPAGTAVLDPGRNTGFSGGCNLGVAATSGEFVALVNSDCIVAPGTLAALVDEARRPGVGPVMASIRLAEDPTTINSAGNPVHLLGVSWAGRLGETETRTRPYDVTGASGACLVIERQLWDTLDGFDDEYFAYMEDTELSLRARRLGRVPRCVPTATATHHYEFSRNPTKLYLLERNRLMLLVTMWSGRMLVALAPMLVVLEVGILGQAAAQGWTGQKVRAWRWLWTHRDHLRDRRAQLRGESELADAVWARALTPRLDPQVIGSAGATRLVNALVVTYWTLVLRLL